MISRSLIGLALPAFQVIVDAERVRLFAAAIGETNPQYSTDIVPPTFLKAIDGENNSSRRILELLEVDLSRVLHVEQQFDYLAPVRAGDCITVNRRVMDIHDKRDGALEFIVIESVLSNASGLVLGRARQLVMVRNGTGKVDA